jgi:hypothetical protein
MKEFKQLAGVRRWHGDEFVALQNEVLEPLQALISDSGNCIISGCVVSFNGTNYVMSAGVFGCKHADGYKIVRLPLTVLPTFTGSNYLYVAKTTETKLYDDGNVKQSAIVYTGAITTVQPSAGLYIQLSNISAIMPRYKNANLIKDSWHVVGTGGEPPFLNGFVNQSNPGIIASDFFRFKKTVDDRVILRGLIDFINLATSTINTPVQVCQLPIGYRPTKSFLINISSFNPSGSWGIQLSIDTSGRLYASVTSIPIGYTMSAIGNQDDYNAWEMEYTIN